MVVASLLDETAGCCHQLGKRLIGLKHLQASDDVYLGQEHTGIVNGENHRNSCCFTGELVIFTVGRCLVNNSCSLSRGHVVRDENLPRVLGPKLFRVDVIVKQALVVNSTKLRTHQLTLNSLRRITCRFVAQILCVGTQGVFREQVTAIASAASLITIG